MGNYSILYNISVQIHQAQPDHNASQVHGLDDHRNKLVLDVVDQNLYEHSPYRRKKLKLQSQKGFETEV